MCFWKMYRPTIPTSKYTAPCRATLELKYKYQGDVAVMAGAEPVLSTTVPSGNHRKTR